MLSNINKTFPLVLVFAIMFTVLLSAQEKQDSSAKSKTMDMNIHKMGMMSDSTHQMKNNEEMTDEKDSIVRTGVIDLQSIDKNKDGKVFQDVMDFNVISDKAGKCPLCGMTLQEVSLEKAKDVLIKNNFKVKEN
jgi:membrane fusion protein, copper/silver efflux system